jgi:hypothetical protein
MAVAAPDLRHLLPNRNILMTVAALDLRWRLPNRNIPGVRTPAMPVMKSTLADRVCMGLFPGAR